MKKAVGGWAKGVHGGVQCLKCHETSIPLELANLYRAAFRNSEDARHLKFAADKCLACHPPNPRWKTIADDVEAQTTDDGAFKDLSVVARAHLAAGDCGSCHSRTAHGPVELKAGVDSSMEPVVLDGRLEEAAWRSAEVLRVPIMGGNTIGRIAVELKAFRKADDLYLAARWPDPRDDAEKAMWEMGTDGRWRALGKKRAGEPGNEDRVMFLWDVSVPNFAKEGCLGTCHTGLSASKYLDAPGMGDLWHWKAARSNPAGYCDDTHMNHLRTGDDGGRHGDATVSKKGTERNINKAGDGPGWMHAQGSGIADVRFLFQDKAVQINSGISWPPGARIPGYLLSRPDGSRGDISAKGVWENGFWAVEFKRMLVTGNPDDVNFNDLGRNYPFAIAVSDNASGAEHSFSGVLRLRFVK